MFIHDDARRRLIEFGQGTFKVCKALIAKEGCVVGDHYHRLKDESFLLLSGRAAYVVIGAETWGNIDAPYEWHVPRGTYHRFEFTPGSVLIGVGTEPFDPEDEIKGKPTMDCDIEDFVATEAEAELAMNVKNLETSIHDLLMNGDGSAPEDKTQEPPPSLDMGIQKVYPLGGW